MYVELLSAAGLVACAARGEPEQRRTIGKFNNNSVYTAHSKVLSMTSPFLGTRLLPQGSIILTGPFSQTLNNSQCTATQYKQQQQESRSSSRRTNPTPEPALKSPLKQM